MNFDVLGPYPLSRHTPKNIVTDQTLKDLKHELDAKKPGLSDACGCYVFAIRAGKGYTPYYVGQACKSSILKESLNPANREKYNKVIAEYRGMPVLFFLPMKTPKGAYRKRPDGSLPTLDFMERWLIAEAIQKNGDLINNKETRFLRNIHIPGLFNARQGDNTAASRELRRALR